MEKQSLIQQAKMHIDNGHYGMAIQALNQLQQISYNEYYQKKKP